MSQLVFHNIMIHCFFPRKCRTWLIHICFNIVILFINIKQHPSFYLLTFTHHSDVVNWSEMDIDSYEYLHCLFSIFHVIYANLLFTFVDVTLHSVYCLLILFPSIYRFLKSCVPYQMNVSSHCANKLKCSGSAILDLLRK